MESSKLTIRVPRDNLEFAKKYAKQHGMSLTQLVDRYFQRLQKTVQDEAHPEVQKIAGLIPEHVDLDEYFQHIERKHT